MSMVSMLAWHIRQHGPVGTARVSSAQARGAAKRYVYWGTVRYQIVIGRDGRPANRALERASTDRRSLRLAEDDCERLCEREGRVACQTIGSLGESSARDVLAQLGYTDELDRHDARMIASVSAPALSDEQRRCVTLAMRTHGLSESAAVSAARADRLRRVGMCVTHTQRDGTFSTRYLPRGDDRDAQAFRRAANQTIRRAIHAACGDRAAGEDTMTLVHMDDYGRLYRKWDGSCTVRVVCPSTGSVYWLPVGDMCRTARQAVASTFGLTTDEYAPVAQA